MAGKLRLTVACGDYEIVRALKEGAVEADGIELVMHARGNDVLWSAAEAAR
jgi:hypothetical protein